MASEVQHFLFKVCCLHIASVHPNFKIMYTFNEFHITMHLLQIWNSASVMILVKQI